MTDMPPIDSSAALSEKIVYARSVHIRFNLPRDRADIAATNLSMTSEPVAFHTIRVVLEMMLAKATDRSNVLLAEAVAEALAATDKAIELQGITDYDRHEAFGSHFSIYSISDLTVAPAFARLFAEIGAPYLHALGYTLRLTEAPSMSLSLDRTRLAQLEARIERLEAAVRLNKSETPSEEE